MKLDSETIIPFPNLYDWAVFHKKFFKTLVNMLSKAYSLCDREDAVEEAFVKLMYKKPRDTYDKEPETEKDWFYTLHWQSRAALSHRRESDERRTRLADEVAKEMAGMVEAGRQGEAMDAAIRSDALARALAIFCGEHDVSRRDIAIYVGAETRSASTGELAARFGTTAGNVYVIKSRVGKLLRKYGRRCYERALGEEGDRCLPSAA